MFSRILSGAVYGIKSYLVHVEVDLSPGLPCFVLVGSPKGEVRESAERVRIALKNTGIVIPPMHISVNLSPADLKKEGTGFDLPIAIGVLMAMGKLPADCTKGQMVMGELGLNGEIKKIRGVLPMAVCGIQAGIKRCLVPEENAGEAEAAGIQAFGAAGLEQVIAFLRLSEEEREAAFSLSGGRKKGAHFESGSSDRDRKRLDFAEIAGQESVKRAALIAAAGFHHMLITGPPGSGKTMVARRLPTILPPLSGQESLEVSSLYSIAGRLESGKGLMTERPFLSPHHTISPQALAGGGRIPKPGVISLAHRGVLFLDEMPQFKRQTLDLLRQPLEDKEIQLARSGGSFTYPADIMLVGAMNPCPCGYYPDMGRCRCTPFERHRYLSSISGPVLDRMDLCIEAPRVDFSRLRSGKKEESSAAMRKKVMKARKHQEERYRGTPFRFNSDLGVGELERYCVLGEEGNRMLEQMFCTMNFSARTCHRLLKVARTIADLEDSGQISTAHLAEAACYRTDISE